MTTLARETPNSLLTESESIEAGKSQHQRIDSVLRASNQRILVACDGSDLVGLVGLTQGLFERNKHCISLMIGLLADYWGRGVASKLLQRGIAWAQMRGISRLEVGVLENNERAISFYERNGFTKEGIKKNALCISGEFVSEIIMAKFFEPMPGED